MADDRKDLPPADSPQFLTRVREVLSTYLGKRGDLMDRGVTLRDLTDAGMIDLSKTYVQSRRGSPITGPGPAVGTGDGSGYEPDLTPPPTPTGVVVTPTFSSLILETAAPTYTQGHGHARTRVRGAKYTGGALPTFADSVQITEFAGNVDSYPTALGTEWHLWFAWVTVDGVQSTTWAGGTNGYSATTGKIGNVDLGPLIVQAGNLADGSVSATKLVNGAIDATKFASGLEPITVVTGVPGAKSTTTIYDTATLKLYRWNGTAYTASVPGADIVANSITAGQIQAGAIGAAQVAAGAITTDKLLVTGRGLSLWLDTGYLDTAAWVYDLSWGGQPAQATVTDGISGGAVMRSPASIPSAARGKRRVPVVVGKKYRISAQIRRTAAANGIVYVRLDTGTSESGSYGQETIGIEGVVPGTSWTRYVVEWTADQPFASPMVLLNYTGTAGYMEAQDIRIEEKAEADLIVDGSIIASKLAANAIAVGTAAIQNGAIVNAMIASLAVDDAKISSLTVAKLLAGSLAVGQYIQSTSFVAGSSGWRIAADGTAEFAAASIRGQLVATQIDSRNLSIKDGAGNVILASGSPLDFSNVGGSTKPANNATVGATIGTNLSGSFTQTSWDTVMTSALIRSAHIQSLSANKISVTSGLSDISGNVGLLRTASAGGRMEIEANRIRIFDGTDALRVTLGYLL